MGRQAVGETPLAHDRIGDVGTCVADVTDLGRRLGFGSCKQRPNRRHVAKHARVSDATPTWTCSLFSALRGE